MSRGIVVFDVGSSGIPMGNVCFLGSPSGVDMEALPDGVVYSVG